jgi:lysyl-tRNA synthetase, class II
MSREHVGEEAVQELGKGGDEGASSGGGERAPGDDGSPGAEETSHLLRVRHEKLETLKARGIPPFAYRFERSHRSDRAHRLFLDAEEEGALDEDGFGSEVRVAGRILSWRSHGRSAFAHIEDGGGRIQVYFRKNVLGDDRFADLDLLDLGDWIGIHGRPFRTRTGEVTVQVAGWELLAKSLRPLPLGKEEVDPETGERVVHSGFADTQTRYRQRYADLAVHPEVRDVFRLRTRIVSAMRSFLDARDYLEVETPILQPIYGGAAARPFTTHHNALDTRLYLRIADELYLKRLIVGGFERVYEIGKDFRNEGIDRSHNPEFTMLEFYEAFADYRDMMDLVEELLASVAREATGGTQVTYQGTEVDLSPPFRRVPFVQALNQAAGVDVMGLGDEELRERAESATGEKLPDAARGRLLDRLFSSLVEPSLVQPTYVVDYPVELSPLAKFHRDDPRLTERFELFVTGRELANAFSELNDPLDQRARFEAQVRAGGGLDDDGHPLDEDYLRAMEYGMPPTGGVGIGVDRLVMLLADQPSIRDVILFPTLRPEEGGSG